MEVVAVELRLGVDPVLPVVDDRTWVLQSLLVVLVERVERRERSTVLGHHSPALRYDKNCDDDNSSQQRQDGYGCELTIHAGEISLADLQVDNWGQAASTCRSVQSLLGGQGHRLHHTRPSANAAATTRTAPSASGRLSTSSGYLSSVPVTPEFCCDL